MFSKWIDESEFDGKNDFFDNSVMSVRQWLAVLVFTRALRTSTLKQQRHSIPRLS